MRTLLTRTLAGLALGVTLASAALAVDSKDNAALRYWRVFSMMTRDINEYERGLDYAKVNSDDFKPPQEIVDKVLQGGVLGRAAVEAASKPECDFGIDWEKGPNAVLSHLGPMRRLAEQLMLDARVHFERGDSQGGAERIIAVLRSAKHVTSDKALISSLVSMSLVVQADRMTRYAIERGWLTEPAHMLRVSEALAQFHGSDPFGVGSAIENEGHWMERWTKSAHADANARAILLDLLDTETDEDAEEQLVGMLADPAGWEADVANLRRYYDLVASAACAGRADVVRTLSERVESGEYGRLATILAPAVGSVMSQSDTVRAIVDDLSSALASE